MEKTCTMCHKTKLLAEFAIHPRGLYGRTSRCLKCRRIEFKNWTKKVKEIGHKLTKPPLERFYSFIEKPDNPNKCWKWKGNTTSRLGYGRFTIEGKHIYAHRYSYIIHVGKIPPKKLVLHTCDNPQCCNPKHLFLGTHKDNSADMVKKRRQAYHGKNSQAVLTEKDVLYIRKSYPKRSAAILSKKFNVAPSTIYDVTNRHTWKYI